MGIILRLESKRKKRNRDDAEIEEQKERAKC